MIKNCILLAFMFVCSISYPQNFDWLVTGGGIKSDKGTTIVVDDAGYSYITGYYNEMADFGPINTGFSFEQSKEVFVAKIDPNGNYVWVSNAINYYDDRGLGLAIDQLGNVFVTGTCWGGLDWPPLYVYNSIEWSDQVFVTKIDPNGNVIWMKNAGVSTWDGLYYNDDHGLDLATDANGNIFCTGYLSNSTMAPEPVNFDAITVMVPPMDSVAFVGKLDPSGTWQWAETFEGIVISRDNSVTIDDEGNVYVTGGFTGTKQFGTTTLTSNGKSDIYVIKYSNTGTFLWVKQAGGILSDRGNGIVDGHDGHVYVTGEFRDVCTFSPYVVDNAGGPKGRDIFVAKLSKSGDWKWVRRAGSKKGSDRGNYIASNDQYNLFVVGQFSSEADFGNFDVDSDGDSVTVFIAAIDTAGIWRWVKTGGGPGYDRGNGITVDDNCNVYAVGYFENTITFDGLNESPNQVKDIFTTKLSNACFGYSTEPPVEPEPEPEFCVLDVPNVFTPNGDNTNEVIHFTDGCNVPVEVLIINRWGQVVFKTNDPSAGWDGTTTKGVLVSEGTYFYSVKALFENEPEQEVHGFITVINN